MWTCKNCSEDVGDELALCWNCGFGPDGKVVVDFNRPPMEEDSLMEEAVPGQIVRRPVSPKVSLDGHFGLRFIKFGLYFSVFIQSILIFRNMVVIVGHGSGNWDRLTGELVLYTAGVLSGIIFISMISFIQELGRRIEELEDKINSN